MTYVEEKTRVCIADAHVGTKGGNKKKIKASHGVRGPVQKRDLLVHWRTEKYYVWMLIMEDTSQWCPSVLEISQVSQQMKVRVSEAVTNLNSP